MLTKHLVILYNKSEASRELVEKDIAAFYGPLSENLKFKNAEIVVEKVECPDSKCLLKALESRLNDDVELYLHFSGHGTTGGIPYDDWILPNNDFAAILDNRKIRFCFFFKL